jgi:TDG/mug DNA glycosylase family protein
MPVTRDHRPMLPDYLEQNLAVVFVGTAAATASAARGHYYAGPGNKFWELLWEAGLTGDRILSPEQDAWVLRYGIGLTDIVKTLAASSDSLLKRSDYDVSGFLAKIEAWAPRVVAFNGKEAARLVSGHITREPVLGRSDITLGSSRVFVLPSSSGANADRRNLAPKSSKAEWWRDLGDYVRSLTA